MNQSIEWYKTESMQGYVVAGVMLVGIVAGAFGYTVTEEVQAEAVTATMAIIGAIGTIYGAYGNAKRTKAIK